MNYCRNIDYSFSATHPDTFGMMVSALLSKLPSDRALLRLVFFGNPGSNADYLQQLAELRAQVAKQCGHQVPAISYVAEAPLDSGLAMEVHSYAAEENDRLTYRFLDGISYVVLQNNDGRFLFAGGFQSDIINRNIDEQSQDVFVLLERLLRAEAFPLNAIARQWNYIERITNSTEGRQHYQSFNNARATFYGKTDWPDGYPAATGIGAAYGGIVVDVDAMDFSSSGCRLFPIDNRLQVAAHKYSSDVLSTGKDHGFTPKFERAKGISVRDENTLVYISGTAAIRGENSLETDFETQFKTTMENVLHLISGRDGTQTAAPEHYFARLSFLRIYLKDEKYSAITRKLLASCRLQIPVLYLLADVCRSELLVEIEGIAVY